jgi:hypothetical protein
MTEHDQNGRQERGGELHVETFAELLGDRWQTSGNGIYRLAEDAAPPDEDLLDGPEPTGQRDPAAGEDSRPVGSRGWLKRRLERARPDERDDAGRNETG